VTLRLCRRETIALAFTAQRKEGKKSRGANEEQMLVSSVLKLQDKSQVVKSKKGR
jgi:hypothetical protein